MPYSNIPPFNPYDPTVIYSANKWGDDLWERHREIAGDILAGLVAMWTEHGRFCATDAPSIAEYIGQTESATEEALAYLVDRDVIARTPSGLYRLFYSVREDYHESYDARFPGKRLKWDETPEVYRVPEFPTKAAGPGYVYLLESGGRYKIGISRDVTRRLAQLRSGQSPFPITLINAVEGYGYVEFEGQLHKRFAHARVRGEWFSLTEQELAEVLEAMDQWAKGG